MKTKILSFLLLSSLFLTSCDPLENLLTFYISDEATFSVNSGLPINSPIEIPTPDITTNSTKEFENNSSKASLVKDIKLNQLKLSITNPSDKTFSFLKEIHLYISTNDTDEIELAYLTNINASTNVLDLTCTSAKLDKYVKSSSYKIRTKITTKETVTQKIDLKAIMRYKVTANPF